MPLHRAPVLVHWHPNPAPGCTAHILMVTHSRCRLVHVQVSNAHGWHGARNMARANEQQKQQEKQKQQQKLKQKQQQQQKKQQQNGGGETGAVSVDGVKARTHLPFAHTASSDTTVCWISPAHGWSFVRIGCTVGRVGEGQGRCDCA